jgi:hypothetical protein
MMNDAVIGVTLCKSRWCESPDSNRDGLPHRILETWGPS